MKLLLDTQLLLWLGVREKVHSEIPVSTEALLMIAERENALYFSAVSVWEVAIKYALGRPSFRVEPHGFRRTLLDRGYRELAITGQHAAGVGELPHIHKDPFDRLLVAQASVEGMTLLTADATVARYSGPVRRV